MDKTNLLAKEILPFSYRSRQIAIAKQVEALLSYKPRLITIVTSRSMFQQFGSRVIVNSQRMRDDYWEGKAQGQSFAETNSAYIDTESTSLKKPSTAKSREAIMIAGSFTDYRQRFTVWTAQLGVFARKGRSR